MEAADDVQQTQPPLYLTQEPPTQKLLPPAPDPAINPISPRDSRVMWFEIEKSLFSIPVGQLMEHSQAFKDMILQGSSDAQEGLTMDKPIVLPGISLYDWEQFYGWYTMLTWRERPTAPVHHFAGIWRVSQLWFIEVGIDYAKKNLERLLREDPAQKLHYAQEFRVSEWIRPCVEQLMNPAKPVFTWTDADFEYLGIWTSGTIIRALDIIGYQRKSFAAKPPPLIDCIHASCMRAWNRAWNESISGRLVHPETPIPLIQVCDLVGKVGYAGDMQAACKEKVVQNMQESTDFQFEDKAINSVITKICNKYGIERLYEF